MRYYDQYEKYNVNTIFGAFNQTRTAMPLKSMTMETRRKLKIQKLKAEIREFAERIECISDKENKQDKQMQLKNMQDYAASLEDKICNR